MFGLVCLSAAAVQGQSDESKYRSYERRECPVLDMPFHSSAGLSLLFAMPAETTAPGWGDLSVGELGAWTRLGNWENDAGGDLDLRLHADSMVLSLSEDNSGYWLTMARLCLRWSQRFVDGHGLEMEAAPGLYSSLDTVEGDDWSVPLGFRYIRALSPDFACFVGATVYPTFDHVVDPLVGLRFAWLDTIMLELGYPDCLLVVSPHRDIRFTAGFSVRLWQEYNMGDDPRDRLLYDEMRASGALELGMTESLTLTLQGGLLMGREIAFEANSPSVDIEDSAYVGVGINARF